MDSLIILITGILGAVVTFYISVKLKQGAVLGSALPSLFVALFFYFFSNLLNPYLTEHIPIVFFGTSFVGMVSSKIMSNYFWLSVAGVIFCIIYTNQSDFFDGFGGGLGAPAFISVAATLGIICLVSKIKNKQKE